MSRRALGRFFWLGAALWSLVAAAAAAQQPSRAVKLPRWAALDSVRLDDPVEAAMASGADCVPVISAYRQGMPATVIASGAFGLALHRHEPRDSTVVLRALEDAMLCRFPALGGHLVAFALALERRIVAITAYPDPADSAGFPFDSVKARLWAAWGGVSGYRSGSAFWGPHSSYRALLVGAAGSSRFSLLVYDAPACTAFDRRLHQLGASGRAEPC